MSSVVESPRCLWVSVPEITLLKRLQRCKIFVEPKRFYDLGIVISTVLSVMGSVASLPGRMRIISMAG